MLVTRIKLFKNCLLSHHFEFEFFILNLNFKMMSCAALKPWMFSFGLKLLHVVVAVINSYID